MQNTIHNFWHNIFSIRNCNNINIKKNNQNSTTTDEICSAKSAQHIDIPKKLVAGVCYDKQHVCAYLQPFSR